MYFILPFPLSIRGVLHPPLNPASASVVRDLGILTVQEEGIDHLIQRRRPYAVGRNPFNCPMLIVADFALDLTHSPRLGPMLGFRTLPLLTL